MITCDKCGGKGKLDESVSHYEFYADSGIVRVVMPGETIAGVGIEPFASVDLCTSCKMKCIAAARDGMEKFLEFKLPS